MANHLQHPPSDIIRQLLIDNGWGGESQTNPIEDWPVFAAGEPDTPDNCITVYDTQGREDGRVMPTGELQGGYGIQIRIRATTYSTGWVKADEIQRGLAESIYLARVTVTDPVGTGTATYLVYCLVGIGDVLPLGRETPTSKRNLFTLNCIAMIEEDS